MASHDATTFSRSASASREAIFVYREEPLGTWRWLVDGEATILEEQFFAAATSPRMLDAETGDGVSPRWVAEASAA